MMVLAQIRTVITILITDENDYDALCTIKIPVVVE